MRRVVSEVIYQRLPRRQVQFTLQEGTVPDKRVSIWTYFILCNVALVTRMPFSRRPTSRLR